MTQIRPVQTRHHFADFLRAPHVIYDGDPNWVPPLTLERKLHFSHKNPYFEHATAQYFVAYRDGRPVGRISAQIDDLVQPGAADGPTVGHFGCLEAVDHAVMADLLEAARDWLGERGITTMSGPYSLSINDEVGLLVDGFDTPPRMLMNYAPPWYGESLEALGFTPIKDLLAYKITRDQSLPPAAARMVRYAEESVGVTERPMDPRRFREELQSVVDIFNDAWAENWGFVPMTKAEAANMADSMKPLIRPDLVRFVERDGEPIAMIVGLPDLHEMIHDLNGKVLPFGWAKLIHRLKGPKPGAKGARVLLMGVRKEHRNGLLGGAIATLLVSRLYTAAEKLGFNEVELSWILDDNARIKNLIESMGGKVYKRYRLYETAIS